MAKLKCKNCKHKIGSGAGQCSLFDNGAEHEANRKNITTSLARRFDKYCGSAGARFEEKAKPVVAEVETTVANHEEIDTVTQVSVCEDHTPEPAVKVEAATETIDEFPDLGQEKIVYADVNKVEQPISEEDLHDYQVGNERVGTHGAIKLTMVIGALFVLGFAGCKYFGVL